jgi:hypothetical protein
MNNPPFFWRGADAIPDYVAWQDKQQEERDEAIRVAATCPVLDATGDE